MTIQKPSIWKLKQWREENGFTTPEWELYVEASGKWCVGMWILGILSGAVAVVAIYMFPL